MNSNSHLKSEDLNIADITNCLNDLEEIDSFFILERGNCSYLQCINYNGDILIEERIYSENGFKHFVLAKDIKNNDNSADDNTDNEISENGLIIDDDNFKIFSNELFSIKEAIDLFTDYYSNIPFKQIIKRDISDEFGKLENGFIFIQWLDSAVDNFKESLDEFLEIIEPFVIDELKKDCVGYKIAFENTKEKIDNEEDKEQYFKCSAFKVIDIKWAVESVIEIALKYEFLEDIIIFKKNNLDDKKFFKLNPEDFKN